MRNGNSIGYIFVPDGEDSEEYKFK